jgi:hypothetical protein
MSVQLLDPKDLPPGRELPQYTSDMRQWSRGGLHPAEGKKREKKKLCLNRESNSNFLVVQFVT